MRQPTVKRNLNENYATPLRSPYSRIREILVNEKTSQKFSTEEVLSRAKVPNTKRNKDLVYTIRSQLKADLNARKVQSHSEALRSCKELGLFHHERYGFACSQHEVTHGKISIPIPAFSIMLRTCHLTRQIR